MGWALHAPTQIQLDHLASSTIQDLLANVEIKNKRVISRTRPSSDPVFDEEAWSKTKEQIAMNVATQPVDDSSEIPFPQLCLVRRHGMWEQLGEFVKLLLRVLDDSSLKMDKTTLCVTNTPTDLQRWIRSQARYDCSVKPTVAI